MKKKKYRNKKTNKKYKNFLNKIKSNNIIKTENELNKNKLKNL